MTWWLLFGGIILFGLLLHGILGLRVLRRVKALRAEIGLAARRIDAATPTARGKAGDGHRN